MSDTLLPPTFLFTGLPTRVVFGAGGLSKICEEAARLGMKRPLVITGKQQSALGAETAAGINSIAFAGAAMHTPLAVTETTMAIVSARRVDGTIAIGGGSAIGLGKAIALRTDLPQLCVPTTYAGSEMSNILGETADGLKTTRRDPRIQPETVIYDPDLTRSLPTAMAATSGLNAIAHAVEGLYAQDGNPIVSLMAEEAIRALGQALPARDHRQALYGAWLCGAVLGLAGMALHHKLCHVLGGSFDMPHAETHGVILPHATAYNAAAAPDAMARIARALGTASATQGLHDLAQKLGAPTSLQQLGFSEANLDRAAALAVANPYWNPAPVTEAGVRRLLENAFHGRKPGA